MACVGSTFRAMQQASSKQMRSVFTAMATVFDGATAVLSQCDEAPLEWLVKITAEAVFIVSIGAALIWFTMAVGMSCTGRLEVAMALTCAACLSTTMAWNSKADLSIHHHAMLNALMFCGSVSCHCFVLLMHPDPLFQHRSIAMVAVLWRFLVPLFSPQFTHGIVCMLICTLSEAVATLCLCTKWGNISSYPRMQCALVVFSMSACFYLCGWRRLARRAYDMHQDLEVEKGAQQLLLSMVSDAVFWLATDGDTVLFSDKRLDNVMGKSMQGELLSHCIPECERERHRGILAGFTNEEPMTTTVRLLHTTLLRSAAPPATAELFIVDRRSSFTTRPNQTSGPGGKLGLAAARHTRGFLIGLRLGQAAGAASDIMPWQEPLPTADDPHVQSGDHSRLLETRAHAAPVDSQNDMCFSLDPDTQVLCEVEGSGPAWCAVRSLSAGSRLLCADRRTFVMHVHKISEMRSKMHADKNKWVTLMLQGCSPMRLPSAARIVVGDRGSSSFKSVSLMHALDKQPDEALLLAKVSDSERKFIKKRRGIQSIEHAEADFTNFEVCVQGSPRHSILVKTADLDRGAGSTRSNNFILLGVMRAVGFATSDDGSVSERSEKTDTLSVASCPAYSYQVQDGAQGIISKEPSCNSREPPFGHPFTTVQANRLYYSDCALSLLEDLVSTLNDNVSGCCAWHSNVQLISSLLPRLHKLHKCDEGWPKNRQASWQCPNCTAVIFSHQPDDFCWLCNEPCCGEEPGSVFERQCPSSDAGGEQ
eukprot:gnl/TRDRNA2_/TRDRNA2_93054_c0_seq2.p1 gnl/TRDRNA2_/TRDRNA2_93054_c0~~gnl/TRDRNA2_/TRDRNA2_93054_c0_seq2.p1  ORF type:complete len:762 (+),score=96.95 gnl/TRDRNA2_/TRDRNA2_93054_c0_seq2:60-2345(+)